ncbi:MAG: type IX secretion system membrane protein PorP/SprF [Bacteroidetes bacterium]|nr:type IX secretion system membrane protein PorP/SprF [Bacteroidota bacterium]
MHTFIHLNKLKIRALSLLAILGWLLSISVFAQQPTLITHYMFTNMATNPAYAGGNGGINITGLVRQQWMGWKDSDGTKSAPQTFLVTVDSPIRKLHGGIGGSISQDQIGVFKNVSVKLGYAYKMEVWSGDLSFGLQGNLQNIGYDASKFTPIDEGDPVISNLSGKTSDMMIDMGLGIFYKVQDRYYVGLSAENLLQTQGKKTHFQLKRTFYLNGGYQWTIPNHAAFELQPSAQILFDGAVLQLNASALLEYNNKFYGGLGYRFQDAVSVLAGVVIKGIRIGVAYDISTSAMSRYNNGSMEILVNYCFKIDTDKFRKSYRNTRFL